MTLTKKIDKMDRREREWKNGNGKGKGAVIGAKTKNMAIRFSLLSFRIIYYILEFGTLAILTRTQDDNKWHHLSRGRELTPSILALLPFSFAPKMAVLLLVGSLLSFTLI